MTSDTLALTMQYTFVDTLVYIWTLWNNSLCPAPLQLIKAINIVFACQGWAKDFFEAGEFVSLHSALCLFVCGSYCRHHVSSPAMMEGQNMLSWLAVST
jgi:hypothetical protein